MFPDFFPGVKCFFPVENFHFGRPKANFSGFEVRSKKKKKKKTLLIFHLTFSIFHLPFYNVPSFFLNFHPFPFFPCLFFPVGQQKFPGQKSLGELCPLPPPTCYATVKLILTASALYTVISPLLKTSF